MDEKVKLPKKNGTINVQEKPYCDQLQPNDGYGGSFFSLAADKGRDQKEDDRDCRKDSIA